MSARRLQLPASMKPHVRIAIALVAAAPLLLSARARAQGPVTEVAGGAGIADFVRAPSALTKLGPEWGVQVGLRTGLPIDVEAAYVGTSNSVNNVMAPFVPGGTITSNGIEGSVRWVVPLKLPVDPFLV